jgi:uncharacterized iron-regulated membrane protein
MPASVPSPNASALVALFRRLHFYIGLFVGPFLLVAALSGVLYALTPQIEDRLYAQALHTESRGPALSLAEQVSRAQEVAGPQSTVAALRPAPGAGDTTRVMFRSPGLGESEHRAIFIDPVSGEVRGDMTVYGTSGVLPLRTWIDQFHRGLLLGDVGRLYSELAASWLWVAVAGGVVLWAVRRPAVAGRRRTLRGWHATAGLWLALGLLFFSATGLTWSQYAGDNIGILRAHYGWSTPSVSTALGKPMTMPMAGNEHAEHHMHMASDTALVVPAPALFDPVLAAARAAGIEAEKVEIRPAASVGKAWVVSEIDRQWPTHVDAASIDAHTLKAVDHVTFAQYSLPAKLTRWGIDAHMGVLFGLPNQLLLIVFASGLAVMVVLGYLMWWRRRPTLVPGPTLVDAWRRTDRGGRVGVLLVAVILGMCLPVLGASLLCFIVGDVLVGLRAAPGSLSRSGA